MVVILKITKESNIIVSQLDGSIGSGKSLSPVQYQYVIRNDARCFLLELSKQVSGWKCKTFMGIHFNISVYCGSLANVFQSTTGVNTDYIDDVWLKYALECYLYLPDAMVSAMMSQRHRFFWPNGSNSYVMLTRATAFFSSKLPVILIKVCDPLIQWNPEESRCIPETSDPLTQ